MQNTSFPYPSGTAALAISLANAEVAELEAQAEEAAAKKAEEDAAKAALEAKKQEVLEKLGLSAEEVAALLA